MKIALCAVEKEANQETCFLNVASYCSLLNKKTEIAFAFFPLGRFSNLDQNETTLSFLLRLSSKYSFPFGVGSKENNKDVYWIFSDGKAKRIEAHANITISNRTFRLVINGSINPSIPTIWLSSKLASLNVLAKESKQSENYYLGHCEDKLYQAAVFQNGTIKCRIPEDHPNILVKSVPDAV